jgi:hypothetical protein
MSMRGIVLSTDPNVIDDRAIRSLVSLLDLQNDATRYWVAEAIGHFGSRARFASPKLLDFLNKRECVIAETSSVSMIRSTLERIGTPEPERNCMVLINPK